MPSITLAKDAPFQSCIRALERLCNTLPTHPETAPWAPEAEKALGALRSSQAEFLQAIQDRGTILARLKALRDDERQQMVAFATALALESKGGRHSWEYKAIFHRPPGGSLGLRVSHDAHERYVHNVHASIRTYAKTNTWAGTRVPELLQVRSAVELAAEDAARIDVRIGNARSSRQLAREQAIEVNNTLLLQLRILFRSSRSKVASYFMPKGRHQASAHEPVKTNTPASEVGNAAVPSSVRETVPPPTEWPAIRPHSEAVAQGQEVAAATN